MESVWDWQTERNSVMLFICVCVCVCVCGVWGGWLAQSQSGDRAMHMESNRNVVVLSMCGRGLQFSVSNVDLLHKSIKVFFQCNWSKVR